MTGAALAGRLGWRTWTVFALGLAAVPLNGFMILFWAWANTHHATETQAQYRISVVMFSLVIAIAGAAVLAAWRRWGRTVAALSVAQILPPLIIFPAVFITGFT